jgi:hemerythrin
MENEVIWKDVYAVYKLTNPEMDLQHKQLFEILNKLEVGLLNINKDELTVLFNELRKYGEEHFYSEEELMKQYDYSKYEIHKKEHDNFLIDIEDLVDKSNNLSMLLNNNLINYVKTWLISHVLGTDKELANFLNMIKG